VEILKQPQHDPQPVAGQVMVIYALTNGFLDQVPVDRIREWEAGFLAFMRDQRSEVGEAIASSGALSDETVTALEASIREYDERFRMEPAEGGSETAAETEAEAAEPAGAGA